MQVVQLSFSGIPEKWFKEDLWALFSTLSSLMNLVKMSLKRFRKSILYNWKLLDLFIRKCADSDVRNMILAAQIQVPPRVGRHQVYQRRFGRDDGIRIVLTRFPYWLSIHEDASLGLVSENILGSDWQSRVRHEDWNFFLFDIWTWQTRPVCQIKEN